MVGSLLPCLRISNILVHKYALNRQFNKNEKKKDYGAFRKKYLKSRDGQCLGQKNPVIPFLEFLILCCLCPCRRPGTKVLHPVWPALICARRNMVISAYKHWMTRLSHQCIFFFPDCSGIFQDNNTKIHRALVVKEWSGGHMSVMKHDESFSHMN